MVAFHDVQFPPAVSYGVAGGPGFKTSVFQRQSGHEDRNMEWAEARCEYDAAQVIKTQKELDLIRDFFYARRGMAYGFRFKDWSDYKSCSAVEIHSRLDQRIGTTDGSTARFRLRKTYDDPHNSYVRYISHPVPGTLLMSAAGTPLEEGFDYVHIENGWIIINPTLSATTGISLYAGFQFDVPVRFGIDKMMPILEHYNVSTWGQIPLLEVRIKAPPPTQEVIDIVQTYLMILGNAGYTEMFDALATHVNFKWGETE